MIVRGAERSEDTGKYPTLLCSPAGRPFPREGEALLYPAFRSVRIKGLTRLGKERYLVALKGAPRRAIGAASVLIAGGSGVYRGRVGYGIATARIPPGRYRLRGGLFWGCELPGSVRVSQAGRGYRIAATEDLPLVPGGRYQLYPAVDTPSEPRGEDEAERRPAASHASAPRGHEPASHARELPPRRHEPHASEPRGHEPASHARFDLVLVLPGEVAGAARGRLLREIDRLPSDAGRLDIYRIVLSCLGWVDLPADFKQQGALGGVELPGSIVVSDVELAHLSSRTLRIVRAKGGATPLEVSRELEVEESLIAAVGRELERTGSLRSSKGLLLPPLGQLPLSPYERSIVESLREASLKGRRVVSVRTSEERVLFTRLRRLDLVEELAGSYVAREAIDEAERLLLDRRQRGSFLSFEEAQGLLAVSRPQTFLLLERLERSGHLRREGERWRVVKSPGAEA